MGVKQLTTYIQENFATLYKDEFHLKGQNLLFDGGALYYSLVRHCDKRFGGDYIDIYDTFKTYFLHLKEIGVKPFIVIDGGANIPLKNATICKRFDNEVRSLRKLSDMKAGQYSFPKPLLLKSLFIEVLLDLQVNYVLNKGEADMLAAVLANRLACPLVSGDSDFFVVPVQHGVIPMEIIMSLKRNTRKCLRFNFSTFAKHVHIKEHFLPFLALIMGNDYSNDDILENIQKHCGVRTIQGSLVQVNERVRNIALYLSEFETIEGVIENLSNGNVDVKMHIESVLGEFDLSYFQEESNELFPILNQIPSFIEKISPIKNSVLPIVKYLEYLVFHGIVNPCLLDIYLHSTHFIRPQCEDVSQKASSSSSELLHSYIYALLLYKKADILKISTFQRKGLCFKESCIEISISDWASCYPVDVIENNSYSVSDKIDIICKITDFPVHTLMEVNKEDHIFLISVRYWVQQSVTSNSRLNVEHLQALLVCYIDLKFGRSEPFLRCHYIDTTLSSHYCRWHSILFYLILLNAVFKFPFQPVKIRSIFHGNHAHSLYQNLESGSNVLALLRTKEKEDMFTHYFSIVSSGIDIQPSSSRRQTHHRRGKFFFRKQSKT